MASRRAAPSDRPRLNAPALRLRGITKRFGSLVANDGISLDLGRGELSRALGDLTRRLDGLLENVAPR